MAKEIVLPTQRQKPENYNPKLLILFGLPKSGKSSAVASLDNNLVIDLEDGYRALSVMRVKVSSINDMFAVRAALDKKMKETGKVPYKFITIDNATRLEEMSLVYAASLYRQLPLSSNWGMKKDKNGRIEGFQINTQSNSKKLWTHNPIQKKSWVKTFLLFT